MFIITSAIKPQFRKHPLILNFHSEIKEEISFTGGKKNKPNELFYQEVCVLDKETQFVLKTLSLTNSKPLSKSFSLLGPPFSYVGPNLHGSIDSVYSAILCSRTLRTNTVSLPPNISHSPWRGVGTQYLLLKVGLHV